MRAKEARGLRALTSHCFPPDSNQSTYFKLVTLRGRPTALRQQVPERESRIVSTGLYVRPSSPASPNRSQLAHEYPNGPTSTHPCAFRSLAQKNLINGTLADQ
jgi:hypothetical protein